MLSLVQLGEISVGRQALEGACLAPGNLATLGILTDPNKRPPVPRQELSQEIRRSEPLNPFELDPLELLTCLRKARRGAAPGPSGMTSDHLFPVLESDVESDLFVQVNSLLAVGNVPEEIIEAIRLGRMTASSEPDVWSEGDRRGRYSQKGEARCRCLEGRSTPPATPTRIEGVGCPNRSP